MKDKDKIIAMFGGSFDPIHFGHLNLAIEIYEKEKDLDEVIFVPTNNSPFKKDLKKNCSHEQKIEMVKLAIEEIPFFSLDTFETEKNDTTYSIDTLMYLKNKYKEVRLIIANDSINDFMQWKDAEKIINNFKIIIGKRSLKSNIDIPMKLRDILSKNLIDNKIFEISSTEMRRRIKLKLYIGHLIPHKVLYYISQNNLYLM